jgi:hypothetical protein
MSHYLKVLMDAVFDPRNFRNEILASHWGEITLDSAPGDQPRHPAPVWEIGPIHALVRAGRDGVFLL